MPDAYGCITALVQYTYTYIHTHIQVGISDSVVSVMQGISNEADLTASKRQLRPRRALEREPDTGHAVLVPYSHEAALAQVIELFIKLFINISVRVSKKQCSSMS
jgi:hypothetical protein